MKQTIYILLYLLVIPFSGFGQDDSTSVENLVEEYSFKMK